MPSVAQARAKEFSYALGMDRTSRLTADGQGALILEDAWTPEHLVLAALVRCTLKSLRFHANRAGIDFVATASATGRVTKREDDGRYAFVEIGAEFDVELEPVPPDLAGLLAKAERDCFVGASLTPHPTYRWRVNGSDVAAA